jgi:hypothetical protein
MVIGVGRKRVHIGKGMRSDSSNDCSRSALLGERRDLVPSHTIPFENPPRKTYDPPANHRSFTPDRNRKEGKEETHLSGLSQRFSQISSHPLSHLSKSDES